MTGLVLLAALLALGLALRAPGRVLLSMLGLLWAGIVLVQLILPEGNPLRAGLGGSLAGWLALGVVAPVVQVVYEITEEALSETARGENGFGSTGKA